MTEQLKGITPTVAKIWAGELLLPVVGGPDLCIFTTQNGGYKNDVFIRRTKPSILEGHPGVWWEFWMVGHHETASPIWNTYCALANAIMNRETEEDRVKAAEILKEGDHIGHMAFWEYDRFPYLLHGVITQERNGRVETEGYGPGNWFTPKFILPLEQGKNLSQKINALEAERIRELSVIHQRYNHLLDAALSHAGVEYRKFASPRIS